MRLETLFCGDRVSGDRVSGPNVHGLALNFCGSFVAYLMYNLNLSDATV